MFLKMPTAKGYKFSLQKFVRLHFHNGAVAGSKTYITNYQLFTFFKQKTVLLNCLTLSEENKCGVKTTKKADVLSLLKYLKPENTEWYRRVLTHDGVNTGPENMKTDSESE